MVVGDKNQWRVPLTSTGNICRPVRQPYISRIEGISSPSVCCRLSGSMATRSEVVCPVPFLEDCGRIIWLVSRKRRERGQLCGGSAAGSHPAAGDPVRLGQHAGRQLDDNPRSAERRHGGDGEALVVAAGDPRTRPAQSARELPASFRRPMGRGAAHLSRRLPRDPSRPAVPAAGPR